MAKTTTTKAKDEPNESIDAAPDAAPDDAAPDMASEPAPAPAPRATAPTYRMEASGRANPDAVALMLDACEIYGVNPEQDQRPVELAAWRYYPGDPIEQVPAAVTLVTAGGVKLKHFAAPSYPMDPDTEERLRHVFGAWRKDKDGTRVPLPLPEDLTLPEGAVTGLVATDAHVYRRGYLREGGKAEGARRAAPKRNS